MRRIRAIRTVVLAGLTVSAGLGGYALGNHRGGGATEMRAPPDARSTYGAGRRALVERRYGEAATLFRSLYTRFPTAPEAAEAPYWAALAGYRQGTRTGLENGARAIEVQRTRYPSAPTRRQAEALDARIQGLLATRDPSDSAASVLPTAREVCGGRGDPQIALEAMLPRMNAQASAVASILEQVSRDPTCGTEVRRAAVMMVAQHPELAASRRILRAAQSDPDARVRAEAALWLGTLADDGFVPILDSLARRALTAVERENAIGGLAQIHTPASRAVLKRLILDRGVAIPLRKTALRSVGGFDPRTQDAAMLREIYGQLPRTLRRDVIQATGQGEATENAEWLLRLALDPATEPTLAGEAVYWASHAGISVARLAVLYERFTDSPRRERLLHAMSESDDPIAVALLRRAATTDSDPELRRLTTAWLEERERQRPEQR